jgi:hypothetical protein
LKRGHTLLVLGYGASHPFYGRDILNQVGTILRLLHCLQRFHVLLVESDSMFGDQPITIPHRGCKQHALAGLQIQSVLLTFLEKEIEGCEQVIFSLRMKKTVIQPYFDVALDVVHHDDEHRLQILHSIPRFM